MIGKSQIELDRLENSQLEPILDQRVVVSNHRIPPTYNCNTQEIDNCECSPSHISDNPNPPSYEDATDPNAPPPSYDSLFGRVRQAHSKSKGVVDFLKNVLLLVLGTLGCSIILGITIVVPISMIVMAFTYWNECPKCAYIPVYLLVGGIVGLCKQVLHFCTRAGICKSVPTEERTQRRHSPWQAIINCFLLGWFFIGSVWVFRAYEPNYEGGGNGAEYCDKRIYLYSFWLLTSVYIFLGVVSVSLCTISAAAVFCQRRR